MGTDDWRRGDVDIASAAAHFAEPARARILSALCDGRALAASVLAAEAGVSAPTASAHLARLTAAGLIDVERSGRHRFYRLAGHQVATALEALACLAEPQPVRSLRQASRVAALRTARTCYDHLAGRLGVAVTAALLDRGALVRTDGVGTTHRRPDDALSARMRDHPYELGDDAHEVFDALGVDLDGLRTARRTARPLLRFCVDWSEQRHHLAGRLGATLLGALFDAGWLERTSRHRVVHLTDVGQKALRETLGVEAE